MNLKHLRNVSVTIAILGFSLLSVSPASAAGSLIEPAPFGQQQDGETLSMSMTFMGWPFLFGAAGLITLSGIYLSDKEMKDRVDRLKQQIMVDKLKQQAKTSLNENYIEAIEAGNNYQTWLELGNTMASQEKNEDAIECFICAIKRRPFSFRAWKGLGDAFENQ